MLNPHADRLDYGDKLKAPEGFTLSHAIATTYTLDLETLLCLPLALSFNCPPEGDLQTDKLALLEAISQLKGKVKVFFQQGCIKLPRHFNLLFSLLEPLLAPQVPGDAFSSFHPKFWLLRFTSPTKAVRYRLLVLSRNLTFDRSWDLAVALEGEPTSARSEDNDGLVALLKALAAGAEDLRAGLELFVKELPRVAWDKPAGFNALKTLPEKPGKLPLSLGTAASTVMVMSPFLHHEALDLVKQAGARHWLFSRAEELDRIGECQLQDWECFALNPCLIEGEDELTAARPQNLHAKLVLLQEGAVSHWHIGSANVTKAALGAVGATPRNTEFMLRLSSKSGQQSVDQLRTELVGREQEPTGIFIPHRFSPASITDDHQTEAWMRRLQHNLIQADWCLQARAEANGTYTCVIECPPPLLEQHGDWVIEVQPLVRGKPLSLASLMVWEDLNLTQVSAFVILRVIPVSSPPVELMIKVRLEIDGGDTREQKITTTLIDSPHKLLAYIQMLLHPGHAYTADTGMTREGGPGADADADFSQMFGGPLHEALLCCAARQTEKLQRIDAILARLSDTEHLVPSELSVLWAQYQQLAWKKKA